jgi:hypothetical protein
VTVTIHRKDQDITVALKYRGSVDGEEIYAITEALDEDGNAVELTTAERYRASQMAREGVDETGR